MAAKKWGEIYLPKQKEPFIEASLEALTNLVKRMQELELIPYRLGGDFFYQLRTTVDGQEAWKTLWIEKEGLVTKTRWKTRQFLGKKKSFSQLTENRELPDLLERLTIGVGDFEKIMEDIDILNALKDLMVLPQAKRLLRPLPIKTHDPGQGYSKQSLRLTTRGIECVGDNMTRTYDRPEDIPLSIIGRVYGIEIEHVRKARAKIEI